MADSWAAAGDISPPADRRAKATLHFILTHKDSPNESHLSSLKFESCAAEPLTWRKNVASDDHHEHFTIKTCHAHFIRRALTLVISRVPGILISPVDSLESPAPAPWTLDCPAPVRGLWTPRHQPEDSGIPGTSPVDSGLPGTSPRTLDSPAPV